MTNPDQPSRFLFAKPLLAYDLNLVKNRGIEYVILPRIYPGAVPQKFYEDLVKEGERVAEFSPYRNPARKFAYDLQPLTGGPFLFKELLGRERNGQILEIYRLRS